MIYYYNNSDLTEIYEIRFKGEIYKINLQYNQSFDVNNEFDYNWIFWIDYPGNMSGADSFILGEKKKYDVIESALKEICGDNTQDFLLLKREIKLDELLS